MDRTAGFRIREWTCEYTLFSLQELAKVTGLSLTHLRVWRSRGHLPVNGGASDQFTSRDVAEVLVRHRLTHGSIPPSESGEIGRQGAQSLLWYAIVSHEVCELWGVRDDVDRSVSVFENPKFIADDLTGLQSPGPYVWRADRDEAILQRDIAAVFEQSRKETHFLVNLQNLATHLVEQAQRPLFKIHVSGDKSGPRVRRFA